MNKGKFLFSTKIKDYLTTRGEQVQFSVYGVFNTIKVLWDYYVISHINDRLTDDLCNLNTINGNTITTSNVRCGRNFKTKEEGIEFIEDLKIKWETGSNDSKSELRDKKIDEIIN